MKCFLLFLISLVSMASSNERRLDTILHRGNNMLTAKMFSEVVKENPSQSVVLSAFSVLIPLAQLALASVGESHDELLAAIGMPNDTITKAVFSRVNDKLKSVKGVTLKTATKIYIAKNFELNNDFGNLTRDIFGSEITNVDFTKNKEAADEVNRWIEEQTNNRIKDLVDPTSLDEKTRSLLVNAIYFKGLWEIPFNKEQTTDRNFHVSKEKTIQVPTMYSNEVYRYVDIKDLKVLELEYKGGESALYILLPYDIDGIIQLREILRHPSLLDHIIEKMDNTVIEVFLPRFKIESTIDLKEVLQNMNVKRLFNENDAKLEKFDIFKFID